MFAIALLLQSAPLVHYNDLPQPNRANVRSCADDYDAVQDFNSRFKTVVFNRELNRGGRLTWNQANDIRYAADMTAKPYLEAIRRIAYVGNTEQCHVLSQAGIKAITEKVIRPVFGN